jgi:glycerol-3-phosphate dehydrogenase
VLASSDVVFRARMARALAAAGLECEQSADVIGVQLAGCAKNAAALAAGLALERGLNAAGTAAARVYAECHELARRWGAAPETFAGVAGAGDLVATILAAGSRNRRAGELIGEGLAPDAVEARLGQAVEALDLVPLLAAAMDQAGMRAPATHELAALLSHAADARERASVKLSVA